MAIPIHKRSGSYLPHWTREHGIYSVRFRLADSVPQEKCQEWMQERSEITALAKSQKRSLSADERLELLSLHSKTVEQFLRSGHGACLLKNDAIAELVANALWHGDEQRYRLFAWCIMPNHVHVVLKPFLGWSLSTVLHSWKSYTANKANRMLSRTDSFWQRESFDRLLRTEAQVRYHIEYTWANPELAGLRAWKWRWKIDEAELKQHLDSLHARAA